MKVDKTSRYEVGCRHILFWNQFFGSLKLAVFFVLLNTLIRLKKFETKL